MVQAPVAAAGSERQMDYATARDYATLLRRRLFGETRAEIRRKAAARETELQVELARFGNQLSETRRVLQDLRDKHLIASEELRLANSQLASKDSALSGFRAEISLLRTEAAKRSKEAIDARAAQAFSGFMSTELAQQVAIQRQMLGQSNHVIEALVNADVATPKNVPHVQGDGLLPGTPRKHAKRRRVQNMPAQKKQGKQGKKKT